MKKAGLVNNKVVLTTSEGVGINYIDGFINKLRSFKIERVDGERTLSKKYS